MGIKTTAAQKKPATGTARTPVRTPATLADALFTATQQRVLGLLFGQPERSFFATELIALARAGSGAVQRELQRLTESGLVTIVPIGNQKHFQANPASPVFNELREIALKMFGPADVLRAALAPLAPHLHAAWLFGSVSKGSGRAQSDIDVLIVADALTLEDAYTALSPAEKKLGRKINPTIYTLKEFLHRRDSASPFLTKVLAEKPIPLISKTHSSITLNAPNAAG